MEIVMNKLFVLVLATLAASYSSAQINIYVQDDSEDRVGGRLVYEIKEELSSSSFFNLYSYKPKDKTILVMVVMTMDKNDNNAYAGSATMYAVVWYANDPKDAFPSLLNHTMGYCGKDRVEEAAKNLVAKTKKFLDELYDYYNRE